MSAHALRAAPERDQMLERPLPHSAAAERAILGAIILDNSPVNQAIELLRPDDFYVRAHRLAFRAMIALSGRGEEINPLFLGEELRREGSLEQVGGVTFFSELTGGVILRIFSVAPYARVILDKSALRRMVKLHYKAMSEALEEEDEPAALLERTRESLSELDEECARADTGRRSSLITTFAEFMAADFEDGEEVAFHARRGELILVQSVTNHGKSTLVRNAALALATGGEFRPVVSPGAARRVLLLNFEGSGGWFQSDLRAMTRHFTGEEFALLNANFLPSHSPLLDGEPLSLSRHLRALEGHARRAGGVDVLIVDTASAAFSLRNENDNSEVANAVMKPLIKLARRLNCLVILVHHVGKAKAEEGTARAQAHRGRRASAWGDFSTSIFNLDADPHEPERVTLTCAKRKNGSNYERVLKLDRAVRWFRATDEEPVKPRTNTDMVLEVIGRVGASRISTAEVLTALDGKMSRATANTCLNRLADLGKISKVRQDWWSPVRICLNCLAPLMELDNCTNCVEAEKPSPELGLAAGAVSSPNGNGFHVKGGRDGR
jgi:replicative DNA helicase